MTRTLIAMLAALLVLAAPAAAKPKTTFTIKGAGYGHGVGMSQYGAMGYAEHGADAAAILAHYYTGTALGTTDPNRTLRIQLTAQTGAARISGARAAGSRTLDPAVTYTVRRSGLNQLQLSAHGKRVATFTAPLQVAGTNGITTLAGHGAYRGALEFAPTVFSGLSVVNVVGLEDYLQGVVPAESPASWPLEALKAQAIAARTYAITTSRGGADFDAYADTRSQMYSGVGVETAASNQAVADTRGQVVTYQGQPVVTYFFSTSGGRTEDVENTTLGTEAKPWLRSVDDPYDSVSPRHRWTPVTMSLKRAGRELGSLVQGAFRGIRVTRRGASPRIMTAQIVGTRGTTEVTGATLRDKLGLFDTWAYFTSISSSDAPAGADPSGGTTAPRSFSYVAPRRAVGTLHGTVTGPARGALAHVQVQRGGGWSEVARVRTGRGGAYRWTAHAAGTYRVVCQGAAGPAVAIS